MLSLVACGGKTETEEKPAAEKPADSGEAADDTASDVPAPPTAPTGQIIIGTSTEPTGDWITTFQNNATDYDILNFLSGYSTVGQTFAGEYVVDETVVESYEVVANADGSKTYTWNIKPGKKFSNGEEIKAQNYVANFLLWNSKFIGDLGGKNQEAYRMVGHKEYSTGAAKEFSGIRLLSDTSFSVTLSKDFLPYFYELALAAGSPEYFKFWIGENEVKDDGKGAYFTTPLTVEAHKTGFEAARLNPIYVSSGSYVVESYDEAAKQVVLKVNPNYEGNYEGQKPLIETVIYKRVTTETQIDELATGQVDMLLQLAGGPEINSGFDLVDKGGFNYTEYPRAGYGKLVFVCDFGPTQSPLVRQAIAHLLDRNDFSRTFTEGYGSLVNGPYGEAQWFFQENKAVLNEKLNAYPYSLEKATELLVQDGWVLDEKGGEYKTGIRYKKDADGKLVPLVIEWCASDSSPVSELLVVKLQQSPDVAAAGMKINQTVMTFTELLNFYTRDGSQDKKYAVPTYHMYNMGVGYTAMYDQSETFTTDPEKVRMGYNNNYIFDEQLEQLAKDMVKNDPTDREKFKSDFVNFVVRWNELLPDLPLYSNIYHDFYNQKLQNWNNNALLKTPQTLIYAYVTE